MMPDPRLIRALGMREVFRKLWPALLILLGLIFFLACYTIAARCAVGNDRMNGLLEHYVHPHLSRDGRQIPAHYHRCEASCPICQPQPRPQAQTTRPPADNQPSIYANPLAGSSAPPATATPAAPLSCEAKCNAQFAELKQQLKAIAKSVAAAEDLSTGNREILGRLEGQVVDAHNRIDAIGKQKPGTTIVQATADDVKKLVAPELDRRDDALRELIGQTCVCPVPESSLGFWPSLAMKLAPASPWGAGIILGSSVIAWALRRRRQGQSTNAGAGEASAPTFLRRLDRRVRQVQRGERTPEA